MNEKLLCYNENINFLFHKNIVEYDMVAASVSISERFNLLPHDVIEELKLLPKDKRTRRVGCIQRDDKQYSERLINGIKDIRKKFLDTNHISDDDILSLHSDAVIFTSNNDIVNIIEGVEFKHKHTWNGYVRYDKIEMFYDNGSITYKGIPKDILNQHTLGINKLLCNIFQMIEDYDSDIFNYIARFQKNYLQDKLPEYYYIPFGNNCGKYKLENLNLMGFLVNLILLETKGW